MDWISLAARHAWPFLKHWNRPMDLPTRFILVFQITLMMYAYLTAPAWVFFYGALFALVMALWTAESVATYRKKAR